MEQCVFKEIKTQDNTPLRLYLTISENSIKVILLKDHNAWKSTTNVKSLKSLADQHKFALKEYCEKLLEHIRSGSSEVVFLWNNKEFTINRVLKGSLMVKFFTCTLKEVNYTKYVEQIMDQLYSRNLQYSEIVEKLKTENEEISKNKSLCESTLNDLITKNGSEQNEQFGQFLLILNEKKRRIQHLTELLEAFRGGRPTVNPQVHVQKKARKRDPKKQMPTKKLETISESENSDSDESVSSLKSNSTIEEPSTPSIEECGPSTSAASFDFLNDSFTQPQVLPKRMKIEKSKENNVVVVPSTSKSPKTEEPQVREVVKSQEIDLSTQQLLDMF